MGVCRECTTDAVSEERDMGWMTHQDDAKVSVILERLLEVLNTPSEAVQRAVSDCLPPLMKFQQEDAEVLVTKLLDKLMKSDKYGERRGAAFGLAGVVKGLGIPSLKRYGIMDALKAGVEDKNSAKAREGALLGFECLCEKLGRLFEPYVIHILPVLLVCFSDPVVAVRDATDASARAIMAQLSAQGVKLVLPHLLKGLEDKAWRTKQGSVQLLGAMAFCAPRQLSQCLPTIVPKLSEVLTDTHPKVQTAAQTALQQVQACPCTAFSARNQDDHFFCIITYANQFYVDTILTPFQWDLRN
jgi:HEAT repeat protein